MARMSFEQVSLPAEKSGKCGCGKRRVRRQRFSQTLNPWNVNADGAPKSRREIVDELKAEATAWRQVPITCDGCQS